MLEQADEVLEEIERHPDRYSWGLPYVSVLARGYRALRGPVEPPKPELPFDNLDF